LVEDKTFIHNENITTFLDRTFLSNTQTQRSINIFYYMLPQPEVSSSFGPTPYAGLVW